MHAKGLFQTAGALEATLSPLCVFRAGIGERLQVDCGLARLLEHDPHPGDGMLGEALRGAGVRLIIARPGCRSLGEARGPRGRIFFELAFPQRWDLLHGLYPWGRFASLARDPHVVRIHWMTRGKGVCVPGWVV